MQLREFLQKIEEYGCTFRQEVIRVKDEAGTIHTRAILERPDYNVRVVLPIANNDYRLLPNEIRSLCNRLHLPLEEFEITD